MKCRVCSGEDLSLVMDLGLQPWGNNFLSADQLGAEALYPLEVYFCRSCSTAQLGYTVAKETMFADHTYVSGTTASLREHFGHVAKEVCGSYLTAVSNPSVLDIGSNDGTQLKAYQELGCEVLGVESASAIAELARQAGVPTITAFFNEETARELQRGFDVINASGVFFHLEELHSVCRGIKHVLKGDGVFIVQFIYVGLMQKNCAFDQVYHEHLLYYSLETIETLLKMHGMELTDAYVSSIHGGSVIGFVSHEGTREKSERLTQLFELEAASGTNTEERYLDFAEDAKRSRDRTIAWVSSQVESGKSVFGLGAPVKGNTLLNYFGLRHPVIEYLVERNPLRRDLFSPGSHIPIVMDDELPSTPDAYLVLAWNFKDEILRRHAADVAAGVEFFFPVDPVSD